MFHGQEDKRECKHTGEQSRGEGSMMEVGVGAEGESIKGGKKGGCARRAEVGRRRRMGRASEIGGATRREEMESGREVQNSPCAKSQPKSHPQDERPHKPKPGPRAANGGRRRLPLCRQGDTGPLRAARKSSHPPFCSAKPFPSSPHLVAFHNLLFFGGKIQVPAVRATKRPHQDVRVRVPIGAQWSSQRYPLPPQP